MNADFSDLYTLTDEVLGSGGFSEVLAGFTVNGGRKVAVKVMDPASMKYSTHEVEILKKIQHRNIIQFLHYFEYDTQCLLVMECLEGGELLDRIISKRSYDENIARDAAKNILLAIQHCHEKNILHRDLKPENLLLRSHNDDTDLVVADFGAAISLPENGFLISHTVGTVGYIAPEILTQQPYSKPADMWSFGIILYILLCGQFPFEDDNQVIRQEIMLPEDEMSQMSDDASSLLRALLKRDPAQRLTAEQGLQHSWMRQPASYLLQRDLSTRVPALRNFLAKRKFKGGVHAIIATNKFSEIAAKARKEKVKDEEESRLAAELTQSLQLTPTSATLPPPPQPPLPPKKKEEETHLQPSDERERDEDLRPTSSSTSTDPTATVTSSSKLSGTDKLCSIQ